MLKLAKSEELFLDLKKRLAAMYHGDRFPSVRQLMKEYEVSQFTVAPAIAQLEEEGYIKCIVGRGTFVNNTNQVKPKKILILSPQWPSIAIQDMVKSLQLEIGRRNLGSQTVLYDIKEDIYAQLKNFDADAIILDPPYPDDVEPEHMSALINSPVPIVIVRATFPNARINHVCGNNPVAGVLAANYLYSNGHRHLALLISEPKRQMKNNLIEGFRHGLQALGAKLTEIDCRIIPGEESPTKTYRQLKEWLKHHTIDFTAMFVVSDETALAALNVFNEAGIAVPEQLSVMGFGNVSSGEFYSPPLTTISTDRHQMAAAALDSIEKCLTNPGQSGFQHYICPELIIRKSVKNINQ